MIRPLTPEDAEALHPALSDPEVMRYWHTPPHTDVEATRATLVRMIDTGHWWAIVSDTATVGFVGCLSRQPRTGRGYLLARSSWRQGLAQNAVEEAVQYAFERCGIERVELWIHESNRASLHLAERTGFTFRSRFLQHYPSGIALTFVLARDKQPCMEMLAAQPTIVVSNVAASVRFYHQRLQFESILETETFAVIKRDAIHLQLQQGTPARARVTIPVRGPLPGTPDRKPWGFLEVVVEDPDGNRLVFTSPA